MLLRESQLSKRSKNKQNIYSKTSSTRAEIFDFPPAGNANSLVHTKQRTILLELPKIICSFLHLEHRTLINLLRNIPAILD